jgi:hypothetical protein
VSSSTGSSTRCSAQATRPRAALKSLRAAIPP